MIEHSIEFLGQKFSYPSTWQGVFSISIICISLSVIILNVTPEQTREWGNLISDNDNEESYVKLNETLINELSAMKKELLSLTQSSSLKPSQISEITNKIKNSNTIINREYKYVIDTKRKKIEKVKTIFPIFGEENQRLIKIEEQKLESQLNRLQTQQNLIR